MNDLRALFFISALVIGGAELAEIPRPRQLK